MKKFLFGICFAFFTLCFSENSEASVSVETASQSMEFEAPAPLDALGWLKARHDVLVAELLLYPPELEKFQTALAPFKQNYLSPSAYYRAVNALIVLTKTADFGRLPKILLLGIKEFAKELRKGVSCALRIRKRYAAEYEARCGMEQSPQAQASAMILEQVRLTREKIKHKKVLRSCVVAGLSVMLPVLFFAFLRHAFEGKH